jgi:pyridinium-3,5-biscarboxylic acid mononucleotide synthase
VLGRGKTTAQILRAVESLSAGENGALVTRVPEEAVAPLRARFPHGHWHEAAGIFEVERPQRPVPAGLVAVLTAGSSDVSVAEEAAVTARAFDARVETAYDVGVAGIHRLLAHRDLLQQARVVVVAAGMEGALASVVAGLVPGVVIAVPTSVGYGASFGGLAALLGMLNSCASGVLVCNIDNGYGAGVAAARINRMGATASGGGRGLEDGPTGAGAP